MANDAFERDPRDWELQGSNDGRTWTTLDTKTGQSLDKRLETRVFDIPNTTAYTVYRLNITAVHGAGLLQLAELRLSDGSPAVPPSGPMVTEVGNGPSSAYAAKTGVGFTGLKALHYAGRVSGAGDGHSWETATQHVAVRADLVSQAKGTVRADVSSTVKAPLSVTPSKTSLSLTSQGDPATASVPLDVTIRPARRRGRTRSPSR